MKRASDITIPYRHFFPSSPLHQGCHLLTSATLSMLRMETGGVGGLNLQHHRLFFWTLILLLASVQGNTFLKDF